MKILRRYILREHAGPFIAALGVLTGLMLLNQLARRFSDLVGKGLPWYVIGEVFALSFPFILAMVVPMAVLVAVLYTFSRLTGDNEVTAFKAGGVSLLRLMLPVLFYTTILAGGMVWFNDKILPESNHALRKLLSDIGRKRPTFELRERVVNEVVPGKLFLQAARIDRMRSVLWDMIIFDLGRPNVHRTIYADSGYMAFNEGQTDLYLTLFDGSMHELDTRNPGTDQSTYYGKQVIRVPEVSNELERGQSGDWRGDREMSIGMMRAEVAEQRERLTQSQDSLETLLASLRPIRALPDTTPENPPLSRPGSPATDRRERDADAATSVDSLQAVDTTTAGQAQRDSATSEESDARSQVRVEDMRRRYRRPRASQWPPAGDPIAFASQTRSRLERTASRIQLQRREINRFEVEIEKKFAIPAAAIVFVLMGAPIAVRFPRGGIGMVIGVSLVAFSVYYIFLIGGEDFADRDFMSPFWAMWAPNAIFTVLGLVLLYLVTLGGTTKASLTRLVPAYGRTRLAGAKVVRLTRVASAEAGVIAGNGYMRPSSIAEERDLDTPSPAADNAAPAAVGAIDLNRATADELARIPGIDYAQAVSILRWQDEHGPIERLSDLLAAPGIDPATVSRLEGKVSVGRNDT